MNDLKRLLFKKISNKEYFVQKAFPNFNPKKYDTEIKKCINIKNTEKYKKCIKKNKKNYKRIYKMENYLNFWLNN